MPAAAGEGTEEPERAASCYFGMPGTAGTLAIVTFVTQVVAFDVAFVMASASLLDAVAMSFAESANFLVASVAHAVSLQAHAAVS